MNRIQVIAASLLVAAAFSGTSTAFAGTDDGSINTFPAVRTAAMKAPAPTAAAASVKTDVKSGAKQDFLQQQAEGSGY